MLSPAGVCIYMPVYAPEICKYAAITVLHKKSDKTESIVNNRNICINNSPSFVTFH